RLEGEHAGDEDIVVRVADDAVGACAADEQVAPGAADEQVVATVAEQDVVAGASLEAVVAGPAVEPGGQGDGPGHLHLVVAGPRVSDQSAGGCERPQRYVVEEHLDRPGGAAGDEADVVVARRAADDEGRLRRVTRVDLQGRPRGRRHRGELRGVAGGV